MGGSTHIVMGAASAVMVSNPKSIEELMLFTGVGAIGGLIADIDTSKSRISYIIRGFLSVLLLAIFISSGEILRFIQSYILQSNNKDQLIAVMIFIIFLLLGTFSSHRGVTHSVEYALLLTVISYFVNPYLVLPLFMSMISHILLDILNYKKVTVSILFKTEICLKLCKSNGFVNWMLTMFSGVIYGIALYAIKLNI